MSNEGLLVEHM